MAQEQGYNVIKFESYRGDGIIYVICKNFDEILSPRIVVPVEKEVIVDGKDKN